MLEQAKQHPEEYLIIHRDDLANLKAELEAERARVGEDESEWNEDHEAWKAGLKYTTPDPPPLVVDDLVASHKRLIEAIDQFIEPIKDVSGGELSRRIGIEVNPLALVSTRVLEGWNASRVPAGDDQGDTPDVEN